MIHAPMEKLCEICGKPVASEIEGALDTDPQGRVRAFHFGCMGWPESGKETMGGPWNRSNPPDAREVLERAARVSLIDRKVERVPITYYRIGHEPEVEK